MRRGASRSGFGIAGGFVLAGLLGLVLALATWVRPGRPSPPVDDQARPVAIHVLDNGFHTDMVAPRAALAAPPGPLRQAVDGLAAGDWVLIGWGDETFYVDQRPIADRLPDGARAMLRPGNRSVLMLRPEPRSPEVAFAPEGRRRLILSAAAFEGLRRRVEGSLDVSTGGPRVAAVRPGDPARFFASTETFSILHLCNHWAAEVLNAAGLPIRPVWSITSGEVGNAVDRSRAASREPDTAGLDRTAIGD